MIGIILYAIAGYWAYGYVNRHKVFFGTPNAIFMRKLVMGVILGWLYIPWAILSMLLGKK